MEMTLEQLMVILKTKLSLEELKYLWHLLDSGADIWEALAEHISREDPSFFGTVTPLDLVEKGK